MIIITSGTLVIHSMLYKVHATLSSVEFRFFFLGWSFTFYISLFATVYYKANFFQFFFLFFCLI